MIRLTSFTLNAGIRPGVLCLQMIRYWHFVLANNANSQPMTLRDWIHTR